MALALLASVMMGTTQRPVAPQATVPGSSLVVSIMTAGVGGLVWERFGHNAIIIADTVAGTDRVYNFGYFSFRQENFFLRFAQGRMLYVLGSRRLEQDLDQYLRADRDVWVQQLNLTPAQALALRDSLVANDTDERRSYRYDYYRDNCSTRVRDALDRALGGQLIRDFSSRTTALTYRGETRRLMAPDPWVGTLIDLAEGHPVDRTVTAWEEMFLPRSFQRYLREVQVTDAAGNRVPLVRAEVQLHRSSRFVEPAAAPNRTPAFFGIGLALGALFAGLGALGARSGIARVMWSVLVGLWGLVAGVGGLLLLYLWLATDHVVASHNENALLLAPLSLGLAVLVPLLARPWARPAGLRLAWIVAGCAALALLLKLLPPFYQPNLPEIALLLPLHVGVALGVTKVSGER